MALLRRVSGPFRELGWGLGSLYLMNRLLRLLSPEWGLYPYEFVVQRIPEQPLLPPALASGGYAERLLPGSGWLIPSGVPAHTLLERFSRGDGGVAAIRKNQLAGYAWWAVQSYQEQEVRCTFEWEGGRESVFDFDVHVRPEHRMGLGFMAVWDALAEQLRREGVRYSYSRISRFNIGSQRAHARLGASAIGRVLFMRAGPLTVALTGQVPYVRVALGGGCRLRLRLDLAGLSWVRS